MPMLLSLRKRWAKALRSGKYKQGEGKLHYKADNEDRWCCLGVLADITGKRIKLNEQSLLSKTQLKALRLSYDVQNSLANKNDHGWTFNELAIVIQNGTTASTDDPDELLKI